MQCTPEWGDVGQLPFLQGPRDARLGPYEKSFDVLVVKLKRRGSKTCGRSLGTRCPTCPLCAPFAAFPGLLKNTERQRPHHPAGEYIRGSGILRLAVSICTTLATLFFFRRSEPRLELNRERQTCKVSISPPVCRGDFAVYGGVVDKAVTC